MTKSFQSRRTSLAPIAAALGTATSEYAERRQEVHDLHLEMTNARLERASNLNELSAKSDAAVEAMGAAQERVANLMADLQATGGLSEFYAFVSSNKLDVT